MNGSRMHYTHTKEGSDYGKLVVAKSICILLLLNLKREREEEKERERMKVQAAQEK